MLSCPVGVTKDAEHYHCYNFKNILKMASLKIPIHSNWWYLDQDELHAVVLIKYELKLADRVGFDMNIGPDKCSASRAISQNLNGYLMEYLITYSNNNFAIFCCCHF